ncbi:MAG: hypothetical protein LAO77_24460 [Acidobacteriia bacterium]|nr:hypothetical protein [Terriglobia bacterium]
MNHLKPEEIVDIAEGTRGEASAPHLSTCDICRAQLREMRAMLSTVSNVDVPEPSPLFWGQLSTRVHGAVAAERPRRSWADLWTWPRALVPAAVGIAVIVAAVILGSRAPIQPGPAAPAAAFNAGNNADALDAPDDPSLNFVADLTANLDWDAASEAGLTGGGSAEHAVTHLKDAELRELARLIKEEVARSGA